MEHTSQLENDHYGTPSERDARHRLEHCLYAPSDDDETRNERGDGLRRVLHDTVGSNESTTQRPRDALCQQALLGRGDQAVREAEQQHGEAQYPNAARNGRQQEANALNRECSYYHRKSLELPSDWPGHSCG
jgi:hypothetical protein